MNRRNFLGLVSAIGASLALPLKLIARHGAHYAERFVKIRMWSDDLTPEIYSVKIFADLDRGRIGVRSDSHWGLFVWELPLTDVKTFMKNRESIRHTRLSCRYENFTDNVVRGMKATIENYDSKFLIRIFEGDHFEAQCEIDIRDVDFLLTQVHE